MSLHKLSAGDGYTYLTRQVAAADDTNRGYGTLASYYEQKGESPGVWMGSGIDSCPSVVPEFSVGGPVSEAQMVALFGEGRHPDADVIERRLIAEGVRGRELDRATRLGVSVGWRGAIRATPRTREGRDPKDQVRTRGKLLIMTQIREVRIGQ